MGESRVQSPDSTGVYSGSRERRGETAGRETERPLEERRKRRSRVWEQLPAREKQHKPGSKVTEEPASHENVGDGALERGSTADGAVERGSTADGRTSRAKNSPGPGQPRSNGSLRRLHSAQYHEKTGSNSASARHIKNWGSFRIPKRSERTAGGGGADEVDDRSFAHSQPMGSLDTSPAPTAPPIRTRLRTGTENRTLTSETDHSQSEQKKRCHTQRLRSHDPMTPRYGSEVLRRGVLAS